MKNNFFGVPIEVPGLGLLNKIFGSGNSQNNTPNEFEDVEGDIVESEEEGEDGITIISALSNVNQAKEKDEGNQKDNQENQENNNLQDHIEFNNDDLEKIQQNNGHNQQPEVFLCAVINTSDKKENDEKVTIQSTQEIVFYLNYCSFGPSEGQELVVIPVENFRDNNVAQYSNMSIYSNYLTVKPNTLINTNIYYDVLPNNVERITLNLSDCYILNAKTFFEYISSDEVVKVKGDIFMPYEDPYY